MEEDLDYHIPTVVLRISMERITMGLMTDWSISGEEEEEEEAWDSIS